MQHAKKREVTVRTATRGDRDVIVDFNVRLAAESEDKQLDRSTVAAGVTSVLNDPTRGLYFIAEVNGRVAGQTMVTFEWSDWRNGWFWWIQSVYVHPDHRGRGVFRALYDQIERRARQRPDVCGLRLYVDADNERARTAYARLGLTLSNYLLYEIDWGRVLCRLDCPT